jgi:hypothetical protein
LAPSDQQAPAPRVYAGIFVCSLAILMVEILLTRIFSFTIWYHLAYLTISTALLGFGAAGSLLSAFPSLLERNAQQLAGRCAAGAALALLLALGILGRLPLDPQDMYTQPGIFFLALSGYYVVIAVPFVLAGMAVSIPLAKYPAQVNRLYAADLFGAGLGCLAAVAGLTWLDGAGAVFVCAALFFLAAALYGSRRGFRWRMLSLAAVATAGVPFAQDVLVFEPAASKALGTALKQTGSALLFTRWSPINRVDVYRDANPYFNYWSMSGLNPEYRGPKPFGLTIVHDGHNGTNLFQVSTPGLDDLQLLDQHILRSPYLLHDRARVLVIGVGGGIDVMNALRRKASRVVGVELQPITVDLHEGRLFNGEFPQLTAGMFQRPEVDLVAAEGRHYVRSHDEIFDIVQITAVDTFSAQSTGAYVLAESYLYTVEALEDYFAHLSDDGVVSIVLGDMLYRDESVPSPLGTRLLMVAREALQRRGVDDPAAHVLLVAHRMVQPQLPADSPVAGSFVDAMLIKKSPFTAAEIERVRSFAEANGFEIRLAPDGGERNDQAIARLLHEPSETLDAALGREAFSLEPVTDDRPFFYHVQRWSRLFGLDRILWYFPGSSVGQLMLLMMLAQAIVLGTVMIALPLWRQRTRGLGARQTFGFLLYFLGLGLGFLLIEISFVQKYVLLLGYPTYSLSVTICSILVFAALGAWLSRLGWSRPNLLLGSLLAVTVALVLAEVSILPLIRDRFLSAPLAVRIAVTVALQFPLGTCLGMYFPTGIELLRHSAPGLVPWAWAVNGIASVASSVLAVMLGMSIGFSGVALVAAAIYCVGTLGLLAARLTTVPRAA